MLSARVAVLLASIGALASPARAEDPGDTVFRFFQEEAAATTALRHPASTDRSPEEGRSSAGTDRAVVSVRGTPRDNVAELLVLIDGRSVYSPVSNGVLWGHLPVQLQDIERIEIVRGPNAALYGANAGLGVINIITRRPVSRFEASATGLGGNLDARQGSASVEAARCLSRPGEPHPSTAGGLDGHQRRALIRLRRS